MGVHKQVFKIGGTTEKALELPPLNIFCYVQHNPSINDRCNILANNPINFPPAGTMSSPQSDKDTQ